MISTNEDTPQPNPEKQSEEYCTWPLGVRTFFANLIDAHSLSKSTSFQGQNADVTLQWLGFTRDSEGNAIPLQNHPGNPTEKPKI